jgi:3-oxoacyl-[acyl-carrier-protein] synthase-1
MKPLTIAATGACTPVGTRAWQTACAVAAKQSAFTRLQMPDHIDHRASVSRLTVIPEEESGTERLIRLAAPALREALQAQPSAWPLTRPMMLFVALPQRWEELPDAHIDAGRFQLELPRALDLAAEYLPMRVFEGAAAAGADALAGAYRFMQTHPETEQVLVGGVDSLSDTLVAQSLYRRGWLKVNRHTEGFIAAEGAAFVRLSRVPIGQQECALVYPPGFGREGSSRVGNADQLSGAGLIQAVQQALDAAAPGGQWPANALHAYWSDIDGSPWRGAEAASLSAALGASAGLPEITDPAAFVGQMGAAWAPLMLSLFHEMRQAAHHPLMPHPLAGHTALQSVSGLDERLAAWMCEWTPAPGARR